MLELSHSVDNIQWGKVSGRTVRTHVFFGQLEDGVHNICQVENGAYEKDKGFHSRGHGTEDVHSCNRVISLSVDTSLRGMQDLTRGRDYQIRTVLSSNDRSEENSACRIYQ